MLNQSYWEVNKELIIKKYAKDINSKKIISFYVNF